MYRKSVVSIGGVRDERRDETKRKTVREGKAGRHWASGRTKMADREKASEGRTETVYHYQ